MQCPRLSTLGKSSLSEPIYQCCVLNTCLYHLMLPGAMQGMSSMPQAHVITECIQ